MCCFQMLFLWKLSQLLQKPYPGWLMKVDWQMCQFLFRCVECFCIYWIPKDYTIAQAPSSPKSMMSPGGEHSKASSRGEERPYLPKLESSKLPQSLIVSEEAVGRRRRAPSPGLCRHQLQEEPASPKTGEAGRGEAGGVSYPRIQGGLQAEPQLAG